MNLISKEVNILINHINYIIYTKKFKTIVQALGDYVIENENVRFNFIYKMINEFGYETIIFNLESIITIDEFIDNKDLYINAGNDRLYNEILIHTSFEPDYNNEELNKYKWN